MLDFLISKITFLESLYAIGLAFSHAIDKLSINSHMHSKVLVNRSLLHQQIHAVSTPLFPTLHGKSGAYRGFNVCLILARKHSLWVLAPRRQSPCNEHSGRHHFVLGKRGLQGYTLRAAQSVFRAQLRKFTNCQLKMTFQEQ